MILLPHITKALLQPIARRMGRTPNGFSGDIKQAIKEARRGEESRYIESFPSQDAYYYGPYNYFPKAETAGKLNPNLRHVNVNFGRDTMYIPRHDSATVTNTLGIRSVIPQGAVGSVGGVYKILNGNNSRVDNFYDAGRHGITPMRDENGNYYMYLDDIYDFEGAESYLKSYGQQDVNTTPYWLQKAAVRGMQLVGTPYETSQKVPVKFVDPVTFTQPNGEWDGEGGLKAMFKNIIKSHNVELDVNLDALSEEDLQQLNVPGGSGDDIVEHWKNLGLLKRKHGGILNYFNFFK